MSTNGVSVVRVRDVLMVTVPVDADDQTISDLQDDVLAAMQRLNSRGLVVDISSVDTLDSFFARALEETSRMVSLMGGTTVVVGMQPSVAMAAVQLGLTLTSVKTALDVDRGLDLLGMSSGNGDTCL